MKFQKEDDYLQRALAVILALAFVFGFLGAIGCASAPVDCPPVIAPEVVEMPVFASPEPIPEPTAPRLTIYDVDPSDTTAVLGALAHDWFELLRAWRESIATLKGHNRALTSE